MKQFLLVIIVICLLKPVSAQEESANKILTPAREWTVSMHKEQLKLTLIIDSVIVGNKVEKMNLQRTFNINFESDYLQVKDNIYIKIFIARNQEYGKKFYSWKWDYLRKSDGNYISLGNSFYDPMNYNQPMVTSGSYGQGIGTEGESNYLMLYYRYKIE